MSDDERKRELADEIVKVIVLAIGIAIALAAFGSQISSELGRLS